MFKSVFKRSILIVLFILIALISGLFFSVVINKKINSVVADNLVLDDQEATVRAIQKVIPAVVSIIVYDYEDRSYLDWDTREETVVNERVAKGSGSGFIITSDGLILTNKHVVDGVDEKKGEFRIILNNGKQYYAQLIGKDLLNDLAILKIFDKDLPYVELGNNDSMPLGTTVIAIGNSLGKYQNSVTKGIVSGLGRNLTADDGFGKVEYLDNVIQTDAEINLGNSGGPLINLYGKVVGINVAIDTSGSAIGFAIPIDDARTVINSVKEIGRIVRPRLGVRYLALTPEIATDNNLPRQTGAWITSGEDGSSGVMLNSPASKAGLQEGDIVFEINAIKLNEINTLFSIVQKYKPGDKIGLKIQRGDKIIIREVVLDEFKQ